MNPWRANVLLMEIRVDLAMPFSYDIGWDGEVISWRGIISLLKSKRKTRQGGGGSKQ